MWIKSFTHMSCQSFRLFQQFSLPERRCQHTRNMARYSLQAGHVIPPLTGLPGPHPSPMGHPWDILGWWVHVCIPSQLSHFQNLNTSWLNNDNVFHMVVGYKPRLLLSILKMLIECINKGGGHTRYNLRYINL